MWRRLLFGGAVFVVTAEVVARGVGLRPWTPTPVTVSITPQPWARPDPRFGMAMVPGVFSVTWPDPHGQLPPMTWRVTHDASGHRPDGPAGSVRVDLHGGSFVYGYGVDDDQTLVAGLQPWSVAARNRAVPGFGLTQMWLQYLDDVADGSVGDVVIVGYAAFHDERTALLRHWARSLAPFLRHKQLALRRVPYTRTLRGEPQLQWTQLGFRSLPGARWSAVVAGLDTAFDEAERRRVQPHRVARNLLRAWSAHGAAHGVRVVVAGLVDDRWTAEALADLDGLGVEVWDVGVDMNAQDATLLPYDAHPSVASHAHWAGRLGALGLAQGWWKLRSSGQEPP